MNQTTSMKPSRFDRQFGKPTYSMIAVLSVSADARYLQPTKFGGRYRAKNIRYAESGGRCAH